MECLAAAFSSIHWLVYAYNGSGVSALNVIAEFVTIAANFFVILLLTLLGWGWTVEFNSIDDWDLYAPMAFLILFVQVLCVGLGKLIGNQYYYHCFDGWVGYVVGSIYVGLFAYFSYSSG